MRVFIFCTVVLLSVVALVSSVRAEDGQARKKSASQEFERIKSLSGDWEVTRGPSEHGVHGGTVSYKVTAGGSAVVETLFGGTAQEMVTVYYIDGNDLALTHYCMLGNRPQMRAERGSSPDKLVFKCREDDTIEDEDHMHQASFAFVDADHLKTDWVLYKGGKPDGTHSFELARKKK